MKFYSEKLDKMFDSIGELDQAEKQDAFYQRQSLNRIQVLEDDIKEIEEEVKEIDKERKELVKEIIEKQREILEIKKKIGATLTQADIDANEAIELLDIFQRIFGKALDEEK